MHTRLTAPNGDVLFGSGLPFMLINDQLRIMDQKPEILDQLQAGKLDGILELARSGVAANLDMADILIDHPELDEAALLPRIARAVIDGAGCPVSLDTRNVDALEPALDAIKPYKALVNSVSAEEAVLKQLLPLVKKYGAAFIAMPMGSAACLPMTAAERLAETRIILDAAEGIGIPREDTVVDCICMAAAAGMGSFEVTLQTLAAVKRELDLTTTLGIGNAGFGMPDHTVIDKAYLLGAAPWGLDSALVDPHTRGLVETVRAMDFLLGRDEVGKRYIRLYRKPKSTF